jgi:hypothetical protein
MKTNILLSLLLMNFILFPLVENNAQTIKKDPVTGQYITQGNSKLLLHGNKINSSKFNRIKFEQQLNKLKKISKLHTLFENMNQAKLKANHDRTLKRKVHVPQLERVKLFGKPTPFYKAPFVPKPVNSFNTDHPLVSNVLIDGKTNDTVSIGDPFSLTFSFSPNSITAVVHIYLDTDNNGIVSPGDLLLTNGLVMDNSDYDVDPVIGAFKMNFSKSSGYSNIVSSLIFEVNDYQSVSYAILTVIPKPSPSVILGTLNVPLKDIIVGVSNSSSATYVLTDSAGKFSAYIDRQISNQVNIQVLDLYGISNGYIPPSYQYLTITSDTTNINLSFTVAKSFIEGYAKDQSGAPIKNVSIEADGSNYYINTKTDSVGYYKVGVSLGTWDIYSSISWTNDYLKKQYSSVYVYISQDGTAYQDILFVKSNSSISGNVSFNANGIEGIPVTAYSDTSFLYNYILTSLKGNYSMPVFKPSSGSELYNVSLSVAPGYYVITPDWYGEPPAQNVNFEFKRITGGIEGTITDSKTGKPINQAYIYFDGNSYKSVYSDSNGYYRVTLLDGLYSMSINADYYLPFSQDNIPINGSVIELNVALDRTGSFSGIVRDEDGKPLYDAIINAVDSSGSWIRNSYSDIQGNYVVSPLVSSKYKACASRDGCITQWYDKVSVPDSASLFSVTNGYDTPNINFVLSKGGSISGKIIDKLGNGISDVEVEVYDTLFNYGSYAVTDDSGHYTVTGLNTGKYYVRTYSPYYIDQWYDGSANPDKAKLVNVIIYQNTPNINFTLYMGSSISGFIKDKNSNPIYDAEIILVDSLFYPIVYSYSDYSGSYSIYHIQPFVKYFVYAEAYGHGNRWYNNVSTPDSAAPIVLLVEENRNNINFILPSAGSISGRVLDNLGVPLPYIYVTVVDSSFLYYYDGYTDQQGNYSVSNLPAGKYYASSIIYGYNNQWFDHKSSQQQADLIKVMEDQITPNINFDLSKISSDSVIIKLKLDKITDTLRFSESYVPDNYSDYWWGVAFDVDGDINTGTYGCEIEIELYHYKSPGDLEFTSNIIDGTYHVLLEWIGNTGYWRHSDVNVRIDPSDKNTLIMSVPKSWTEISQITSNARYYAHTFYYSSSGGGSDYTGVGKDMVTITDPVGDVSYNFIDIVSAGWNLKTVEDIHASDIHPVDFKLEQNYPNPFNPSTTIRYALPYESSVKIMVYNLLGQVVRQVVSEVQKTGYHEVNFSADNLSSGVYFYSIVAGSTSNKQEFKSVKKMLLLK